MPTTNNQPDNPLDKVLGALRDAAPPEGLEARVSQRLAAQPASAPSFASRWRDPLLAPAWWRGAFAGAAAATLVFAALLLASHIFRARPAVQSANNHAVSESAQPVALREPRNAEPKAPCLSSKPAGSSQHPTILRVNTAPSERSSPALIAATTAPSRPAPQLGLTPQERDLLQLAHTVPPRDLASLTPEGRARADAQEHAAFVQFFTPPPAPPQPQPDINNE